MGDSEDPVADRPTDEVERKNNFRKNTWYFINTVHNVLQYVRCDTHDTICNAILLYGTLLYVMQSVSAHFITKTQHYTIPYYTMLCVFFFVFFCFFAMTYYDVLY